MKVIKKIIKMVAVVFIVLLMAVILLMMCTSDDPSPKKMEQTGKETAEKETKKKESKKEEKVNENGFTDHEEATYRMVVESMTDEYLADYKSKTQDWEFAKFDDEGRVLVTTKYILKDSSEKQPALAVVSFEEDTGMMHGYFLSVGDKIYLDDGSCDEFFENLSEINQAME